MIHGPEKHIQNYLYLCFVSNSVVGTGYGALLLKEKKLRNEAGNKTALGRIIGYTLRHPNTENMGDFFAVVGSSCVQNELIWAQKQSGSKGFKISSDVTIAYHPRDKRDVRILLSANLLEVQSTIEKNLNLLGNIAFTILILSTVVYYYRVSLNIIGSFSLSIP
ncbi:MAG: hypothetical protein U5K75_05665 [Ahrensia sp.]|nr:hypothetical protein [Ahrensia sp.]